MRRPLFITAFALFLAVPLWAQRGGHGGFGGHAGFHSGQMGSGHFSAGMSSGRTFSHGFTHSSGNHFSHGPFLHNGFHSHNHFHHSCFGFGCRNGFLFPWWGAYYDPYWDWQNTDDRFDADYYNNIARANEMNEQSLEQQRLRRQEEADGDQDVYARPAASRSTSSTSSDDRQETPALPTILVFRDQHQQEVQNYAIVGQTLWNLSPPRRQKISLAELDLAATEKANDDRGVTFHVPAVSEGQ